VTEEIGMSLNETPEVVNWPPTHYVFIEKVGPFMENAPQAWGSLHQMLPQIAEGNEITGYLSLYKVGPKIYRAGVAVAAAPAKLPDGLKYEEFKGGKYSRFVLTGSYAQLGQASGRVFEIAAEKKLKMRDDYCVENYLTDPRTTPEADLRTEILIPTE
jgi:effector-binding domain-containing protein